MLIFCVQNRNCEGTVRNRIMEVHGANIFTFPKILFFLDQQDGEDNALEFEFGCWGTPIEILVPTYNPVLWNYKSTGSPKGAERLYFFHQRHLPLLFFLLHMGSPFHTMDLGARFPSGYIARSCLLLVGLPSRASKRHSDLVFTPLLSQEMKLLSSLQAWQLCDGRAYVTPSVVTFILPGRCDCKWLGKAAPV